MTKLIEYRLAIKLRRKGRSYSQIKKDLNLSKSTLSRWLRKFPLNKNQISALRGKNQVRIEKFRQTMKIKRDSRLLGYYNEQKNILFPFTNKELLIAGLFLYWGEGNKASRNTISINNTDPSVLRFAMCWLIKSLKIPRKKIQVFLHLYSDMNIGRELEFWSEQLSLPKSQFAKTYIKKSFRINLDQKGFGHGTCGLSVYNTVLKENILMAIKAISDKIGNNLMRI